MAYKDEYEVARLYTDGEFARALADRFEGDDLRLEFYMIRLKSLALFQSAVAAAAENAALSGLIHLPA